MTAFCRTRGGYCLKAASLGVTLAAFLLFIVTFHHGIQRGYDQVIPVGNVSRVVLAIASYLTEIAYGERGYVLDYSLYRQLESRGISRDPAVVAPLGLTAPDNLKNAAFIDAVLDGMLKDIPNYPPKPTLSGHSTEDVGLVTFTKLAFFLFGRHIRAYYYLFFLIFAATVITAFIERRNSLQSQCLILTFMLLFYLFCFYSPQFLNTKANALGTFWNPHFITQLGVIPLLHILLMMIDRVPFTPEKVSAVIAQSLVIGLVIHIRSTGVYLPIALFVAALGCCVVQWWSARGETARASLQSIARLSWPAVVAIVTVVIFIQTALSARHPVYRVDGAFGRHTYWHSIYYSLQFHPQFQARFGAMHENRTGDAMPYAGVRWYLKQHPELDTAAIYAPNGELRIPDMERLARLAFMEFVRRHPKFVFEMYLKYKAPIMFGYIGETISAEWRHMSRLGRVMAAVAALLAAAWLSGRPEHRQLYRRFTACVCAIALTAFGMIFMTVPGFNDPETILAVQFAALLLVVLGLSHCCRHAVRLRLAAVQFAAVRSHRSSGK